MTTLEIILTTISALFFLLYVFTYINSSEKSLSGIKYLELIDKQEQFINQLRRDYDSLVLKFFNLLSRNKEQEMKEAMEEFIQCCSEEREIQHYKELFQKVLK